MDLSEEFRSEILETLCDGYSVAGFTRAQSMQKAREDIRELEQYETKEETKEAILAKLNEVKEMGNDFTRRFVEQVKKIRGTM